MTRGVTERLREYQEKHALDGRLLRWAAARCLRPHPEVGAAPRSAPHARVRVSVVIPCFNYARYLPEAVASALGQRDVDVEVIIVDDCSTDDSHDVALRLAASDARVRAVRNATNSGHVRSFNAGWRISTGELVVKLDADDLLTPGSLARAAALFEQYPDVALVYGHPRHFVGAPPAGRIRALRWDIWVGRTWLAERCRLGVSAITNPEMVIRSEFMRRSGPMDPEVAFAPDMELSLRAAAHGGIGYIGGADQALHREHPASMSATDGAGVLVDLEARREAFRRALANGGLPAAERDALSDLSRSALAADALRYAGSARDHGRPRSQIDPLLAFAAATWPESVRRRDYRRAASSSPPTRWAAFAGRAKRRLRDETYRTRWYVSGI